jgi:2-C-methyl-D-erythritol 4-phosphate cytidylyltransferase/2-C-methyl-D-erythritol 2,4-cyclodiphosphate synthase
MIAVLVVAAGRGQRAGDGGPKQYRRLAGLPVLHRSLVPFLEKAEIGAVTVAIHADDAALYEAAVSGLEAGLAEKLRDPVIGGATRQDSVRLGLQALVAEAPEMVLVHDAARPFCSGELIARAIAAGRLSPAAIPATPVTDTIKQVGAGGVVVATPDRAALVAVQTPQVYAFAPLLAAHLRAHDAGLSHFTDDAALVEWAGLPVETFRGDAANVKLTYEADFISAETRLSGVLVTRVASGYDVHSFTTGDHVWLGGVRIPHDRGVEAHSDGDVALHALTDALLGVLSEGDIGTHFPPSDPEWRGASSDRFLAFACERVRARGGVIDHLDLTIVCEAPRVGPHREAMRERIAAIADLAPARVSIKATTSERMGFTGRREGLVAFATATLRLPVES